MAQETFYGETASDDAMAKAMTASKGTVFTEGDRVMLTEIHSIMSQLKMAVDSLPLDKLAQSPMLKMLGL